EPLVARHIIGASWAFILAALSASAPACAQEAVPKEYGYKLAGRTSEATYFMSGFKRGEEPGSVEAWVWIVLPGAVSGDGEPYDAKAQLTILRCTSNSTETLRTEFYRKGEFLRRVDEPVGPAVNVKPGSPMTQVWNTACNS